MRNIPHFTCEYGAAQLILEQIPENGRAFVLILWRISGKIYQLLEECKRFCRLAGAEAVLVLGETTEEEHLDLSLSFQILEMQAVKQSLPCGEAALFPVTTELLETYLRLYNKAMDAVDGAKLLTKKDAATIKNAYFIHKDELLLGIGQTDGDRILALAACRHGEGQTVLCTLAEAVWGEVIKLTVADTNKKAISLYSRMGFIPVEIKEHWYEL